MTETEEIQKDRLYQKCIITDDLGIEHTFTGPARFFPGGERKIASIKFTEPQELPKDCHFENLTL